MGTYDALLGGELRELAINGKLIKNEMTEEDYTAIIDYELNTGNPDTKVMDFCLSGLKSFPKYNVLIKQPDFNTLLRLKHTGSIDKPQVINLRELRFKFGVFQDYKREISMNPYEKKLEQELTGKYHEKITKNGKVFYIWTHSGSYNITYLDHGMVGNVISGMSLETAKSYISFVA